MKLRRPPNRPRHRPRAAIAIPAVVVTSSLVETAAVAVVDAIANDAKAVARVRAVRAVTGSSAAKVDASSSRARNGPHRYRQVKANRPSPDNRLPATAVGVSAENAQTEAIVASAANAPIVASPANPANHVPSVSRVRRANRVNANQGRRRQMTRPPRRRLLPTRPQH